MNIINTLINKMTKKSEKIESNDFMDELLEAKRLEKSSIASIGNINNARKCGNLSGNSMPPSDNYEKTYFPVRDGDWYLVYSYRNVEFAKTNVNANYRGYVRFNVSTKIEVCQGENLIGYISDFKKAAMISDFLNRNDMIKAQVDGPHSLYIGFYKTLRKNVATCPFDIFKLTKTSSMDETFDCKRYENLYCVSDGDLLELEYNDSTGSYIVYDNGGAEIGELSRKDSRIVNEKEDLHNIIAFITNLSYNDDKNRYECDIEIYYK